MAAQKEIDVGKLVDARWRERSSPFEIPYEGPFSGTRTLLGRWVLIAAGVIALAAGTIGVFVPLLPTTPFLLLAAACFFRSSDRLYQWLIHHRWLGDYIRNYREHRAMTRRAKVVALTLLWSVIGYSAVIVATSWRLRLFLGLIAVGVTLHLLHLKTMKRNPAQDSSAAGLTSEYAPGVRWRDDSRRSGP